MSAQVQICLFIVRFSSHIYRIVPVSDSDPEIPNRTDRLSQYRLRLYVSDPCNKLSYPNLTATLLYTQKVPCHL